MAIIKRETDYALRVLGKLGAQDDFLPVSALAQGAEVPELYLRKIMQRLQHADLVESRQGPFGGYRLALAPDQITLLDVVETIQGPLVMNECFNDDAICGRICLCPVRMRLAELQVELNAELAEVTIGDIVREIPLQERAVE